MLSLCLLTGSEAEQVNQFATASPTRALVFPQDHGKHSDFQTEWWYFTGNLQSEDGERWGFQFTIFRRSLFPESSYPNSAWGVRDLYPAHFALTRVNEKEFFHGELLSREGPGLAGAARDRLLAWVRDWKAEQEGKVIRLTARDGDRGIDLELTPVKPVVLHGRSGFSRKGDRPGQASHYYSYTRLRVAGTVTARGLSRKVQGLAWMDHEFGSSILLPDQAGWDWFSIQLDDNTELMVFHLRREDGSFERAFGTFVRADGTTVDLHGQPVVIESTDTWTSPRTGAVYPAGWRIEVPRLKLQLVVEPYVKDQELSEGGSTGIIYWEGAVSARGRREERSITGRGYVELTGYAGSIGGRL
jgi:predicted secreted hydrolase